MINDPDLNALTAVGGWSILAAASRSVLSEDRRSITGFLRGLVMATFVGMMVSLIVKDYNLTPGVQGVVVGVASFVADDILLMIITASTAIRNNPREAFAKAIEFIVRGKSGA
jgi:hypothetical protein